eukprot:CAMPEP_0197904112 /NCGR_PEP_ID=MMETSP1439-20131203/57332_1 /TAXON_ID=66791 /ORGANISM="Gonyaulax spinifera, Strain CCMP409" /LENGTH=63 /DNA_ID=CAMNT_0043525275 /DNA_START=109 /DNA_END=300 /DNA_ORIENTATION=-
MTQDVVHCPSKEYMEGAPCPQKLPKPKNPDCPKQRDEIIPSVCAGKVLLSKVPEYNDGYYPMK